MIALTILGWPYMMRWVMDSSKDLRSVSTHQWSTARECVSNMKQYIRELAQTSISFMEAINLVRMSGKSSKLKLSSSNLVPTNL